MDWRHRAICRDEEAEPVDRTGHESGRAAASHSAAESHSAAGSGKTAMWEVIAAGMPSGGLPARRSPLLGEFHRGTILGRHALRHARGELAQLDLPDTVAAARGIVCDAAQTCRARLQPLELLDKVRAAAAAVGECALDIALMPVDGAASVADELRHRWAVRRTTPPGATPYTGDPCRCGQRSCASYRWSPAGRARFGDPAQSVVPAPFGSFSDGRLVYLRPGPDGQVLGGSSGPAGLTSSRQESDR